MSWVIRSTNGGVHTYCGSQAQVAFQKQQKDALRFNSYFDAAATIVAFRWANSEIVKLKPRPRCPTCGRAR